MDLIEAAKQGQKWK